VGVVVNSEDLSHRWVIISCLHCEEVKPLTKGGLDLEHCGQIAEERRMVVALNLEGTQQGVASGRYLTPSVNQADGELQCQAHQSYTHDAG